MRDIYERLKPLGFDASFVRSCILPSWWEDKLAEVPANRSYAATVIARQLGFPMSCLRDKTCELSQNSNISTRFKCRQGTQSTDLVAAQTLGCRLAMLGSKCLSEPLKAGTLTASTIRGKILESGAKWVGLEELLAYCWTSGIPVIHLNKRPRGKKMDGMVVLLEERPVIIVASGWKQPAWHLFTIAHELGHLACGHLSTGEASVDRDLRKGPAGSIEEEGANTFATRLLAGTTASIEPGSARNAPQLAVAAASIGELRRINPGFVVLSYAWKHKAWPVGSAALNELYPDAEASGIYKHFYSRLELDELVEDNRHLFDCLTEA